MKRALVAALVATMLPMPLAFAQTESKPPAAQPAPDWQQMQERMRLMQERMNKLRATTDPAERQRLLEEHFKLMQEQMASMRGLGGPMMGGGMGPGMMGGGIGPGPRAQGKPPGPIPSDQRLRRMEERLDLMQQMMEQMLQQEGASRPPARP